MIDGAIITVLFITTDAGTQIAVERLDQPVKSSRASKYLVTVIFSNFGLFSMRDETFLCSDKVI